MCTTSLHNPESSKCQIDINLPRAEKVYSISFRCNLEEILERQLITVSAKQAFATFSPIENALAGRKKNSEGPHATRVPCIVQA